MTAKTKIGPRKPTPAATPKRGSAGGKVSPTPKASLPTVSAQQTGESKPAESDEQVKARLCMSPLIQHTRIARSFLQPAIGIELDIPACVAEQASKLSAIKAGDLTDAEQMLFMQATSLNAIFLEMVRRAGLNVGEHLGAAETYLRLAFKAQSQSRCALEALAEMKTPRATFINAKQANYANGPQQVNNGVAASPPARTENIAGSTNKLLGTHHDERVE